MPFVRVCGVGEVGDGRAKRFEVGGKSIVVYNCSGKLFANDGICTHALADLVEGSVDRVRCLVECPLHGAEFDLSTGEAVSPPAAVALRTFPLRVEGADVLVGLPD
jgi:3-phenylpropionate/trans-cinnamate dioxygenase ferredoxin component